MKATIRKLDQLLRDLRHEVDAAPVAASDEAQQEGLAALRDLRVCGHYLEQATDELTAQLIAAGVSVRATAHARNLAPNSLPPRLARTASLGAYADPDGRVSGAAIARARYDTQQASAQHLTFRKRVPTSPDRAGTGADDKENPS